ncbi:MAG: universal stress protein [Burkholderiales bacterium]|nr:universal stress protein [Burkholderiales bacterium]
MFRNILVPTDGSALSRKAVKKAVALAKKTGARVTGFHVTPSYKFNVYADYIPPDFLIPRQYEALQKKVAARHLEVIRKECRSAGVKCATWFVSSDFPADDIIKAARKYKCDLIAMASHGRRGFSKLLLGSETQKVLAGTNVAVLVLR